MVELLLVVIETPQSSNLAHSRLGMVEETTNGLKTPHRHYKTLTILVVVSGNYVDSRMPWGGPLWVHNHVHMLLYVVEEDLRLQTMGRWQ